MNRYDAAVAAAAHAAAADPDDLVRLHPGRGAAGGRHGAGAEMRQSLGTAVFSGMLGVTFFGLIFTPVFYVDRAPDCRSCASSGASRKCRRSRRSSPTRSEEWPGSIAGDEVGRLTGRPSQPGTHSDGKSRPFFTPSTSVSMSSASA